jgi:hypothetical protein
MRVSGLKFKVGRLGGDLSRGSWVEKKEMEAVAEPSGAEDEEG